MGTERTTMVDLNTKRFLEEHLSIGKPVTADAIKLISSRLILKSSGDLNDCISFMSPRRSGVRAGYLVEGGSSPEHLIALLKQKEHEYKELKQTLQENQKDLQDILDLNDKYLANINHLNAAMSQLYATKPATMPTPRHSESDTEENIDSEMATAESKLQQLTKDLTEATKLLDKNQSDIAELKQRDVRLKTQLGLREDADEDRVVEKIEKLQSKESSSNLKEELKRTLQELQKIKQQKLNLEGNMKALTRQKDQLEFNQRQQDLTIKKMQRVKISKPVLRQAQDTLTAHQLSPTQTQSFPSLNPSPYEYHIGKDQSEDKYCVLCRTRVYPVASEPCRIHFRPIKMGKWTCCNDDRSETSGCMTVSHWYIEITKDKKISLTNGAKSIQL